MTEEKVDYTVEPHLVETIKAKKNRISFGLTILDGKLFVVTLTKPAGLFSLLRQIITRPSSSIDVYDSKNDYKFIRSLVATEIETATDIASFERDRCLYVVNAATGGNVEVVKTDPEGLLIKKWPIGDDSGSSLSVTDEGNLLVTVPGKNKLQEYSPEGELIREIQIPPGDMSIAENFIMTMHPCNATHAIKLTDGQFLVGHREMGGSGALNTVSVMDADGKDVKTFGRPGSGDPMDTQVKMNNPVHLVVDGEGSFLVADLNNSRVLLFGPDLKFRRELLTRIHGLRKPTRIHLDWQNGRLYVSDNEMDDGKEVDGRVLIFNLKWKIEEDV